MSSALQIRSRRVLLVDADHRTSRRLADLLREDGFEVEVAGDGRDALARLSRRPVPGALITELGVPLAAGATIVRHARAQNPGLLVIVLTRHPHLLLAGSFAGPPPVVLTKPLDYAQLLLLLADPSSDEQSGVSATSPRN